MVGLAGPTHTREVRVKPRFVSKRKKDLEDE